jgi:hypothetical protein
MQVGMATDDASAKMWANAGSEPSDDAYGPEPDAIMLSRMIETTMTEGYASDANPEKAKTWTTTRLLKLWMSVLACGVFIMVYVLMVLSLDTPGIGLNDEDPTRIKAGTMLGMMDMTADVCTSPDRYACGTYNDSFIHSSLFTETQLRLIAASTRKSPLSWKHLEGTVADVDNSTTFVSRGFFDCVAVEIDVDIYAKDEYAIYLSPAYVSHGFQHGLAPVPVTGKLPDWMSIDLVQYLDDARTSGTTVLWQPLNETYPTVQSWNCNESETAEEQYISLRKGLTVFDLVDKYYNVPVPLDHPSDVDTIVATVREMLVGYIEAATFITTDAARLVFKQRVRSITIYTGYGVDMYPRCVVGTSFDTCLANRWLHATNLLGTTVNGNELWSTMALEVNAYYAPRIDAIYIPWTIMQAPFYSNMVRTILLCYSGVHIVLTMFFVQWPIWMQMASLGAVIAHELGHAIKPGYSFPTLLSPDDNALLQRYQMCLEHTFMEAGVTQSRAIMTLDENWADAVSLRTITRYFRRLGTVVTHDGILLWMQTWCAAGSPLYTPLSVDPHSTSHMRIVGTVESSYAFYDGMGCTPNPTRMCGI